MNTCLSNHDKNTIEGVRFDLVDYDAVLRKIQEWRQVGERTYVCITNPHCVLLCHRDPAMAEATAGAGLTLPDGVGIVLAARILGYGRSARVTGPALMLRMCDQGREHDLRHYFYGGGEGVANRMSQRLAAAYPGLSIAGTSSPPFRPLTAEEESAELERMNRSKADVIWVGLGAPKQEKWMAAHRERLEATVLIGVGAAFDFHSGNVKWAPRWMRTLGLEWLYRTVHEPRRVGPKARDSFIFGFRVLAGRMRWSGPSRS